MVGRATASLLLLVVLSTAECHSRVPSVTSGLCPSSESSRSRLGISNNGGVSPLKCPPSTRRGLAVRGGGADRRPYSTSPISGKVLSYDPQSLHRWGFLFVWAPSVLSNG